MNVWTRITIYMHAGATGMHALWIGHSFAVDSRTWQLTKLYHEAGLYHQPDDCKGLAHNFEGLVDGSLDWIWLLYKVYFSALFA